MCHTKLCLKKRNSYRNIQRQWNKLPWSRDRVTPRVQKIKQKPFARRLLSWSARKMVIQSTGLVRTVKNTLMQIWATRSRNDELLRNVLMETENIINSRPLTYLPIEHAEQEALTPNHFLLGSSNGIKHIGKFTEDSVVLRKNWNR